MPWSRSNRATTLSVERPGKTGEYGSRCLVRLQHLRAVRSKVPQPGLQVSDLPGPKGLLPGGGICMTKVDLSHSLVSIGVYTTKCSYRS